MRKTFPLLIGIATASLLVAGCKKQEQPPVENQPVEQPQPPAPPPPPKPVAATKPVAPKAKAAPPTTAEQQVIDDADATGMTARTDRSGDADSSANGGGNSQ